MPPPQPGIAGTTVIAAAFVLSLCGTASAGENGAMVLANQTYLFDHDDEPSTPPVERALFDAEAAEGDNIYLRFLRDRLAYDPADPVYTKSRNYPVVAVLDNGIDNGGPTDAIEFPADMTTGKPLTQDFYEFGDRANPSRYIFSFFYKYRESNFMQPWVPGIPSTYPQDIVNYSASDDDAWLVSHGHGVSSVITSYNGRKDPLSRHDPTQLGYGIGVNPFGRIGNARIFYDEIKFVDDKDGLLEPFDFYWTIDRAWRAVQNIDGGLPSVLIANCSFGFEKFPDGADALDPMTNPTGATYDFYARFFDAMTRNATDNVYTHPRMAPRPTLFVFGCGQFGQEYYGNGWEKYLDGGTPERSAWESDPSYIHGFHVPRANTVSSPGLAKNVLTVGASVAYDIRPLEACPGGTEPPDILKAERLTAYGDSNDLASYSPRGMDAAMGEFRIKPDIVAPSSGDYASIWTVGLEGFPQCSPGTYNDIVSPVEGTFAYIRSGGTSGAVPMISGFCQLSDFHLRSVYGIASPTPALLKAYTIHTGKMLRGAYSGKLDPSYPEPPVGYDPPEPPEPLRFITHKFPSPYQGFGRADLSMALDRTPRVIVNQGVTLGEGLSWSAEAVVADANKPFRATLVWTDAVDLGGSPELWLELMNNLDLKVTVTPPDGPERLYVGNRFSDETLDTSQSFESEDELPVPDRVNNVECVFLEPQPVGSKVRIEVTADGLTGDALDVWNAEASLRRQDFALVVYNALESATNGSCEDAEEAASDAFVGEWQSSPDLLRTDISSRWYRLESPNRTTSYSATISSDAPVFSPGNSIEWHGEGESSVVMDPERGEATQLSGRLASGTEDTTDGAPGWGIPAWDLEGKSELSAWLKTESRDAVLSVYIQLVDKTITTVSRTLEPGGWKCLSLDLAGDTGVSSFDRVVGISVDAGDGVVLLDELELAHPASVTVFTGSDCGRLEESAIARPGDHVYIRVDGNAGDGSFTVGIEKGSVIQELLVVY